MRVVGVGGWVGGGGVGGQLPDYGGGGIYRSAGAEGVPASAATSARSQARDCERCGHGQAA